MKTPPVRIVLCSTCGRVMNPKGECLSCLLGLGFDPPSPELLSCTFGDFEIARRDDGSVWELGRGAMGVTYRADDKVLHRSVALKVIEGRGTGDGRLVRDRFLREARAAAAFHHPNVAGVFHFGASPDGHGCYYAMELVEGETLEALVRRDGPLSVEMALEIAAQVTQALIAAAAQRLVHRDLKPGNIMLVRSDSAPLEVKVIDFGLAKAVSDSGTQADLTQGGFVGTPAFASPEQFSGAPADARSDIYSLGVTLWYALTGEVPFNGKTIEEIRLAQSAVALPVEQLAARRIPLRVVRLLRHLLALEPTHRPASPRQFMDELTACRARLGHISPPLRGRRTVLKLASMAALLAASLTAVAIYMRSQQPPHPVTAPAKSIAVLPFENLSADKENAYFADGVQDDILSALSKIEGLKVINRTSVMSYQVGTKRNLREIAQALGVANILEGSVRRAGGKVRVTAQLIDAHSDAHLWGETYDRDLADVFAIQSDIAVQIAIQLQAKLSPEAKSAIEERPTKDLVAADLYARAKSLVMNPVIDGKRWKQAAKLLDEAVTRDPDFFLAYCLIAQTRSLLYWDLDHTPAQRDSADVAVKAAFRLRPEAGEAHLAHAHYLSNCNLDYDKARAELALAQRKLPNNAQVFALLGSIDSLQGRWSESTRAYEAALELDPRNLFTLRRLTMRYQIMRRFAEAVATLDRLRALAPQDAKTRVLRAWVELEWRADPKPLHETMEALLEENPVVAAEAGAEYWLDLALCERDLVAATRALKTIPNGVDISGLHLPRALMEGCVARTLGEERTAVEAFTAARVEVERAVREQPDHGPPLCVLGVIDAGLGRKEEAIREGRRARELLPLPKDALGGAQIMLFLAVIYAWTGEKDLAIEQIAATLQVPGYLCYGQLRLHPLWDPLRGDPRFEKLVASVASKPGE